ncbi:Imm26 family immunity protein [Pedobacter hiemivivus]|nr:Imm26 family immunity protein [Pedobacter hiemivivus]
MEVKRKPLRLKEGDVFTVPIDETTKGYGQIVKIPNKSKLLICVFEGRWDINEEQEISKMVKQPILFLGFTSDALLFHRKWVIIGNITTNLPSITMPLFKLAFPPETKLVNYKLEILRKATPLEDKLLPFQSSNSPIGYQKALQAYYDLLDYDLGKEFEYKHIVSTLIKLNLLSD